MIKINEKNGLKLLKSDLLSVIDGVNHTFTTRVGGISEGPYSSLNIYSSLETEFEKSLQNRERLGITLGFNHKDLVLAQQVHGDNVFIVKEDDKGRGAISHTNAIPATDSLITNLSNIPIMLLYADCLPILISEKNGKCIGVIHAGWKSTEKEILPLTLKKMIDEFKAKKENLYIAIGIGISIKNFEIGQEVKDKLEKVSYSNSCFQIRDEKIYADLIEINKSQAVNFGIPIENIDYNKDLCTFENEDLFYSYRRDNKITGRHSAVIIKN